MDDTKRQMIELIAREVCAALKQQAANTAGQAPDRGPAAHGGSSAGPRADVRPPIGICTGDYSKFPELRGRLHGATSTGEPLAVPGDGGLTGSAVNAEPLPLTGIITAKQLQQAWDVSADGSALLADDARLTPLANDLARQNPERIRRATLSRRSDATSNPRAVRSGPAQAVPWFWWLDGQCPAAQAVVARHGARFCTSVVNRAPNVIGQVVRDLASSLKVGRVAGGVLFVHSAARANCYANRCPSIRAVVGTCAEAVDEGIRDLGSNVLLIEYPHVAPRQIEAMVHRMIAQSPAPPPQTVRELADLRRCE